MGCFIVVVVVVAAAAAAVAAVVVAPVEEGSPAAAAARMGPGRVLRPAAVRLVRAMLNKDGGDGDVVGHYSNSRVVERVSSDGKINKSAACKSMLTSCLMPRKKMLFK